jgi:hypothetical protein
MELTVDRTILAAASPGWFYGEEKLRDKMGDQEH